MYLFYRYIYIGQTVVVHTFNPSTWESEAVVLWIQGQSEFQDSQNYTKKQN